MNPIFNRTDLYAGETADLLAMFFYSYPRAHRILVGPRSRRQAILHKIIQIADEKPIYAPCQAAALLGCSKRARMLAVPCFKKRDLDILNSARCCGDRVCVEAIATSLQQEVTLLSLSLKTMTMLYSKHRRKNYHEDFLEVLTGIWGLHLGTKSHTFPALVDFLSGKRFNDPSAAIYE